MGAELKKFPSLLLPSSLGTPFSLPGPPDFIAEDHGGESEFTEVGLKGTCKAISENSYPLRQNKNHRQEQEYKGWCLLPGDSWQMLSNDCIFLHFFFQSDVPKAGLFLPYRGMAMDTLRGLSKFSLGFSFSNYK